MNGAMNSVEIVDLLLEKGADIQARDKEGDTVFRKGYRC